MTGNPNLTRFTKLYIGIIDRPSPKRNQMINIHPHAEFHAMPSMINHRSYLWWMLRSEVLYLSYLYQFLNKMPGDTKFDPFRLVYTAPNVGNHETGTKMESFLVLARIYQHIKLRLVLSCVLRKMPPNHIWPNLRQMYDDRQSVTNIESFLEAVRIHQHTELQVIPFMCGSGRTDERWSALFAIQFRPWGQLNICVQMRIQWIYVSKADPMISFAVVAWSVSLLAIFLLMITWTNWCSHRSFPTTAMTQID